ncbi:hypothetical protein AF67_01060 [Streptococcus uberis 6780]|nr:hypothetical protein AF67_01060 [Streptococcus uberis 6780]KKF57478.1 hypothetical protein AF69_05640 [Streptococcus uberis 6736]KKF60802.1 hypothetical protein AF58_09950 [Streptococcus uberis C6344]
MLVVSGLNYHLVIQLKNVNQIESVDSVFFLR